MATVKTIYTGNLRTKAVHLKSNSELITDAPVDNHGKGEAFSPTDLLATSFGCCMITVVGIAADAHGFSIDGAEITTTKVMYEEPRRIGELNVEIKFPPNNYSEKEKNIIINTAKTCPVAKSLHPDVKQDIRFIWDEN